MLGFKKRTIEPGQEPAGLAAWLLARFQGRVHRKPKLELIERISLAPRQSLALVEAEGQRFLVACSADSTPAFFPIEGGSRRRSAVRAARVSW